MAGEQKGSDDIRYLWPEMLRVIREFAPHWVVAENVPGILNIAADEVCSDLEREGYEVAIFDYEAAAVGATHRRRRIAFVAHSNSQLRRGILPRKCGEEVERNKEKSIRGCDWGRVNQREQIAPLLSAGETKLIKPLIFRSDDGVSDKLDRNKCLGNAVVPQQFYPIFKAIADIERSRK